MQPSEARQLTGHERTAFARQMNRAAKEAKKRRKKR